MRDAGQRIERNTGIRMSDIRWKKADGSPVSCTEKIKVLRQNLDELRQMAQDAFEDALLMECEENQIREVFQQLVADLHNPYEKP